MMKKIRAMIALLLTAASLCGIAAIGPARANAVPVVKAVDTLWYGSGRAFYRMPDESEYYGRIETMAPKTALPTRNSEANFDCVGAPYVLLDDGLALLYGGQWQLFLPD